MHRITLLNRTDGRTDGQTDRQTDQPNPISLHFTGDNQGFMGFETDWILVTLTDMFKSISGADPENIEPRGGNCINYQAEQGGVRRVIDI